MKMLRASCPYPFLIFSPPTQSTRRSRGHRSDTAVDLGAERTVVAPRVDLFVLEEVATLDAGLNSSGEKK